MISSEELKELIEKNIPGARVEVRDLTGTEDHYEVTVVSEAFAGKSLLEQHQMVYKAVGEKLTREIHALSIKTFPARNKKELQAEKS